MIEKTLVLLKPDAVQRGLIGEVISRFEKTGLKIVGVKMVYANEELVGKHYTEDIDWLKNLGTKKKVAFEKQGIEVTESEEEIGRQVRKWLMDYITMSPVLAMVLEGHNAIEHVRKLVGPTEPRQALPGTIRGDFSFDTYELGDKSERPVQNLIHASDSIEAAESEINLWFKPEEIHVWRKIDEDLIYRNFKQGE